MPEKIANKLSALLNISVKEIKSVDYANEKLSDDATKALEKIFKMLGELELWQLNQLDEAITDMSLMNGVIKYRKLLQANIKKLKKNVKRLKGITILEEDYNLLLVDIINLNNLSNLSIHYETMLTLIDIGLLPENQLKDFIKYFSIIK